MAHWGAVASKKNWHYLPFFILLEMYFLSRSVVETRLGIDVPSSMRTVNWRISCKTKIPPEVWMFVCCECCQVEVSATSWSLVQRSPTDCGAHRGHGRLSVVSVVCCQIEVSASGWSLVQRSPTDCGASLCVWCRNLLNEESMAQWGLLRQTKNYLMKGSVWMV